MDSVEEVGERCRCQTITSHLGKDLDHYTMITITKKILPDIGLNTECNVVFDTKHRLARRVLIFLEIDFQFVSELLLNKALQNQELRTEPNVE